MLVAMMDGRALTVTELVLPVLTTRTLAHQCRRGRPPHLRESPDALNREHGAQARPADQGVEERSLGAGEHPAPDQPAVRVVKGVAVSAAGCANAEASLVEVLHHGRVRWTPFLGQAVKLGSPL